MILLDTDLITVLQHAYHPRSEFLSARLAASGDPRVAMTVISIEEQMRGWLAEINRWREVHRQVRGYDRLASLFRFYARWEIVPFTESASDEHERLRSERVRIGTQDLKIASITLANDALLLSANLRDFQKVPGAPRRKLAGMTRPPWRVDNPCRRP